MEPRQPFNMKGIGIGIGIFGSLLSCIFPGIGNPHVSTQFKYTFNFI